MVTVRKVRLLITEIEKKNLVRENGGNILHHVHEVAQEVKTDQERRAVDTLPG